MFGDYHSIGIHFMKVSFLKTNIISQNGIYTLKKYFYVYIQNT
ncbi:hypothetical protein LEP1GSC166_1498 [Leptospira kirschneri]|nr:hypothetical protein LEP1GSC166_1498 [Leptospira kirschneri]